MASAQKRELKADIVNAAGATMGTIKFTSADDVKGGAGVTVEGNIKGLVPARGVSRHAHS